MRQSKATGSKNRILAGLLTALVAFTGLTALNVSTATPSFADIDFGIGGGSGGGGSAGGGGSSGGQMPGAGNPGGNPGGGGGGTGGWVPVDRYAPYWATEWGGTSLCPNRLGVGQAIGISKMWQIQTSVTPSKDTRPAGEGWVDTGTYITGYGEIWERTVYSGKFNCHYPPAFYTVVNLCVLNTTANLTQVRPSVKGVGSGSRNSGYAINNPDPEACKNSKSAVNINTNLVDYSLVEGQAITTVVNNTFKIYTEVDPRTGVIPAPELQKQGTPYQLTPNRDSISISCSGVDHPANYNIFDFTDKRCATNGSANPPAKCLASPVQFYVSMVGSEGKTWNSFPNNSLETVTGQIGNPGMDVKFSQGVSGKDLTVTKMTTTYKSSIPYTELDTKTDAGLVWNKNVLTGTKKSSGTLDGQKNYVNLVYNGATEIDANLKLTQVINWSGTRREMMPATVDFDPITGKFVVTSYKPVDVKTSGICEQSVDIPVTRGILGQP